MDIKCPHCGIEYEVDESVRGRKVECATCGTVWVAGDTHILRRKSVENNFDQKRGCTQQEKEVDKEIGMGKDGGSNSINFKGVKCPHCGNVFPIEEIINNHEICPCCGNRSSLTHDKHDHPKPHREQTSALHTKARGKTAADTAFKRAGEYFRERTEKNLAKNPKMVQFIRMLATSPWTVQFSAVYLLMFGLMFMLCILLTSKLPSSFIHALMTLTITVTIAFTLPRFNFVRWMLIVWGAFNLILLVFGSKDFAFFWPFHVSFAAVAILLLVNMTRQWYKNGPAVSVSADIMAYQRVSVFALILAVIANVAIYVGYNSARKHMRSSRGADFSYDMPIPSSTYSPSYKERSDHTERGALENVRRRYNAKLSRYGLTESYFDETNGICDLMLLAVASWTKYQIVYYRSTGRIEWPRIMPKNVAEDLMEDRLLIHTYETTLGTDKRQ